MTSSSSAGQMPFQWLYDRHHWKLPSVPPPQTALLNGPVRLRNQTHRPKKKQAPSE